MEDKISPWESVVAYVWALNIRENKGPYLSGRRLPLFEGPIPQTQSLAEFSWLPTLKVADQAPQNLGELVCLYKWKKIQARIQWILELWLKQGLPLKVTDEEVTPYQMLEEQSRGWRVVTLKEPLSFVLHDLEHAERFFHNEQSYLGQIGFYRRLQESVENGFWSESLQNPNFEKAFFYLMSDMNTHCVHMLKYLRAILWENFGPESEVLWSELTRSWNLPHQLVEIENYFVKYGRELKPKGFFSEHARVVSDLILSR